MSDDAAPAHPLVAATLDVTMFGLRKVRQRVVAAARGDVLDIGVGTGLSLASYPGDVVSIVGVEPDRHMLARAARKAARLGRAIELVPASAERLPFGDARFDTVVATFVLCTIPSAEAALAEALRVLKPGGQLLFCEHVRSSFAPEARVQDALDPLWTRCAAGCHLNRDSLGRIRAAGFDDVEHRTHGRTRLTLSPVISGVARKRP